jgi:hypothetical protein
VNSKHFKIPLQTRGQIGPEAHSNPMSEKAWSQRIIEMYYPCIGLKPWKIDFQ